MDFCPLHKQQWIPLVSPGLGQRSSPPPPLLRTPPSLKPASECFSLNRQTPSIFMILCEILSVLVDGPQQHVTVFSRLHGGPTSVHLGRSLQVFIECWQAVGGRTPLASEWRNGVVYPVSTRGNKDPPVGRLLEVWESKRWFSDFDTVRRTVCP